MSGYLHGCKAKSVYLNFTNKQAGFSLIKLLVVLGVIAILVVPASLLAKTYQAQSKLQQSRDSLRVFQQAVIHFYQEYDRTPSTDELYQTYLRDHDPMDFLVAQVDELPEPLPDPGDNNGWEALAWDNDPSGYNGPARWIIVSKRDFLPAAEFIYAVDNHAPVTVPRGQHPFDRTQLAANTRP